MNGERIARWLVLATLIALPLAVLLARVAGNGGSVGRTVEIHGRMPEGGGWSPEDITVGVGERLRLRLTSDDVVHGFAVGKLSVPAVDVKPGEMTETTLTFDRPGKYVFYCTRWCGANHWRMRGTIEVTASPGASVDPQEPAEPLYLALGLDLDAHHSAGVLPERRPSARPAEKLGVTLSGEYLTRNYYRRHTPEETWRSLRAKPVVSDLDDQGLWDLTAWIWEKNSSAEALAVGEDLYRANCAACHGVRGRGDGVMAEALAAEGAAEFGHGPTSPADFGDPERMLGASPALLHGKIVRGGMGTGMPYWGPIFTDEEIWAIVQFLWTFQFDGGRSDSLANLSAEGKVASTERSSDREET